MNITTTTDHMTMTFFTDAVGWGDVVFPGFSTDNYAQFFGILLFSFCTGAVTIYFSKKDVPTNNILYFLFYTVKSCLHFISMNLAMTMNVWVFLCVCLGQGAGHLKIKHEKEPGYKSLCDCGTCTCEPATCECT